MNQTLLNSYLRDLLAFMHANPEPLNVQLRKPPPSFGKWCREALPGAAWILVELDGGRQVLTGLRANRQYNDREYTLIQTDVETKVDWRDANGVWVVGGSILDQL